MSKSREPKGSAKKQLSLVRSSAAEYLTFVAARGTGGVEAVCADENIWLTQKMMGVLYNVETHTVNYHLKKVFADSELQEESVIRNFRITWPSCGQEDLGLLGFSQMQNSTALSQTGRPRVERGH